VSIAGKCQTVCKPGSVAGFPRSTAIHLGRSSPNASRDQPERRLENPPEFHVAPRLDMGLRRSYSVLLPVGFTVPSPFPGPRCALTAPFHPCRPGEPGFGGLLSVALSLGSPPPVVNRHRVSAEPGLSSPRNRFRGATVRPSDGALISGRRGEPQARRANDRRRRGYARRRADRGGRRYGLGGRDAVRRNRREPTPDRPRP